MGRVVRHAEARDLPAMVDMAARFVEQAHDDLPVDREYLDGSLRAMLVSGSHLVLVLDVDGAARGVFCAVASRSQWSPVAVASELGLWIEPDHRGGMAVLRILRAYSEWASEMGCVRASMVALSGRSLARLYERAGFLPAEFTYSKGL